MVMKRLFFLVSVLLIFCSTGAQRSVTLEECRAASRRNYPSASRYEIIDQTREATLENIAKGWLPQVNALAQTTYQSAVSSLPSGMSQVLAAGGQNVRDISKLQYCAALDVEQTIYDGGQIKTNADVARAQANVEAANLDTELYGIEARAEGVFFGVLLMDERLQLVHERSRLLRDNLRKIEAMLSEGTAAACDVAALKAEVITCRQDSLQLVADRAMLVRTLILLCGFSDNDLRPIKPSLVGSMETDVRPELRAIDSRLALIDAQEKKIDSSLRPHLGVFAQGWYGYTGYDMFHDMMHRNPTFNGMVGVRLSWNISPLYTRRSNLRKLSLQRDETQNARETFLLNQRIADIEQQSALNKWRSLLKEDDNIITLRTQVRQGAEARLYGGIADVNALVQELSRENTAKDTRALHELQMLQAAYSLRHNAYSATLNQNR